MIWLAAPSLLVGAFAAPPQEPGARVEAALDSAPLALTEGVAWTRTSRPALSLSMSRLGAWRAPMRMPRAQQSPLDGPPVRETDGKRRSRNLLLGAVATELAAGALLGGAMATKGAYEDADEPTRGMYRANRVMGHAGYASAIAGGAMVLGSISMWEW